MYSDAVLSYECDAHRLFFPNPMQIQTILDSNNCVIHTRKKYIRQILGRYSNHYWTVTQSSWSSCVNRRLYVIYLSTTRTVVAAFARAVIVRGTVCIRH